MAVDPGTEIARANAVRPLLDDAFILWSGRGALYFYCASAPNMGATLLKILRRATGGSMVDVRLWPVDAIVDRLNRGEIQEHRVCEDTPAVAV